MASSRNAAPTAMRRLPLKTLTSKRELPFALNVATIKAFSVNVSGLSIAEILAKPPSGCSIHSDGQRVTFTASFTIHRRFSGSGGFCFVLERHSFGFSVDCHRGALHEFDWTAPALVSGPRDERWKTGNDDRPMDLGMTLFLCVFLIPFVTVGIGMTVAAVVNLIGKVEVIIDEFDTYVATELGLSDGRSDLIQGSQGG